MLESVPAGEKKKPQQMGCLIAFGVVVGLIILANVFGDKEATKAEKLDAQVSFTGTQFVIENRDAFDWKNCKLDVNGETFSDGFVYEANLLQAGQTYTVGALQFADDKGQRFNPITYKPTSMSIACDTSEGRAHYHAAWK